MKRKEKTILFFLAALIFGAIIYSADRLLLNGVLSWQFQQKTYLLMLGEILLLFGLTVFIFRFFLPAKACTAAVLLLGIFLWMHQILFPIIVSGLYSAWLWLCGRWLRRRICSGNNSASFSCEAKETAFRREFFIGCLFTLCCFCLMSALGIGKIIYLWVFMLAFTATVALDWRFWKNQAAALIFPQSYPQKKQRMALRTALTAAGLLTLFAIQAGRMSISVDFDSIWYGTRSPYILNNGGGIYENLGTIGVVYTYSKGLEVLTLPLSLLPSYSFGIAFNLWLAAGVLLLSRQIGKFFLKEESSRMMTVFLASLPGIMNMSITAKSDMATLYIQLMMIAELLCFLSGERRAWWYAAGAFFFSWTLKPTAMVFSTAIMGMSILYLPAARKFFPAISGKSKPKRRISRKGCPEPAGTLRAALSSFALSLAALTGIWTRTFLITGLPVTSVFSSVLTRLGFTIKYPFNAKAIPNNNTGITAAERITAIISRIYGVLFNPQGKDLDHVIIAWGSLSTWFLLCLWLCWLFMDKKKRTWKEHILDAYLGTIFLPFSVCCLISLILLYQVDGNYFMLFYVLSALCAFRLAERLSSRKAAEIVRALTLPILLFSAVVTTLTSWAWSLGFTPIVWKNKGYYPHQEKQHQEMIASGNGQIWEILSQNPRNRLITVGDHPQTLVFPCNAQSYRDITKNAWGNPELAKSAENFTEFMAYAKTDYIYIQADYITQESREWYLIRELLLKGILVPLCCEQGNVLAFVDMEGTQREDGEKLLEEFIMEYTFSEN